VPKNFKKNVSRAIDNGDDNIYVETQQTREKIILKKTPQAIDKGKICGIMMEERKEKRCL